MSPEQARGEQIDQRSDVFSLGIVLFEAVTSTRLYHFDEPFGALSAITGPDVAPLARSRNPHVPAALEQIIARALAKDLNQRFRTSQELHAALEEWLRTFRVPPRSSDLAAYMRQIFRERIAARAQVLDRLNDGEVSASAASAATTLRPGTDRSMPGGTQTGQLTRQERRLAKPAAPAGRAWGRYVVALVAAAASFYVVNASTSVFKPTPDLLPATLPAPEAPLAVAPRVAERPAPEPPVAERPAQAASAVAKAVAQRPAEPEPPEVPAPEVSAEAAAPAPAARAQASGAASSDALLKRKRAWAQRRKTLAAAEPKSAHAPATEPAPAPVQVGKLTLDTVPWTEVTLDGRKLGETPLNEVPVTAGKVILQLPTTSAISAPRSRWRSPRGRPR